MKFTLSVIFPVITALTIGLANPPGTFADDDRDDKKEKKKTSVDVAGNDREVIYACVRKDGRGLVRGRVRIVQPWGRCDRHEALIQWNVKGPAGAQGERGPMGPEGPMGPQGPQGPQGQNGNGYSNGSGGVLATMPGSSPETAGSCEELRQAGMEVSGVYYVINPYSVDGGGARAVQVYCDQETNGGGWALVYNSVLGINTLDFWNIPFDSRLGRFGRPSLDSNFYDGSLYQSQSAPATYMYMDVYEDLRGKSAVAVVVSASGLDADTMRFISPQNVTGDSNTFTCNFNSGWSARDHDGDTHSAVNCSSTYNNVTQHYCNCWDMNLGSDAEGDGSDERVGPHVARGTLEILGLSGDGTNYSRMRRISRFVKW